MSPVQRPDSYEAADYVGVLRRRWWVVLALTVLGVVGALGYVMVAPKSYTATAAVNVTPTAADQNNSVANSRTSGATVNLDTEAQVVKSTAVAAIAAHLMHSPLTPWQLSQQVTVTVPPNSSVLDIACSAPTASAAATCAEDFAHAYLQNRSASAAASVQAELHTVQGKTSTLLQQANTLTSKINALPTNSSLRLSDETLLHNVQGQLHQLTTQEANLTGQLADISGGTIITNATPPGKPSSPKKLLILPSGLVAGLLLGLLGAFLWDRSDRRVHGAQDVERLFDVPVVLDLPAAAVGRQAALVSPRSRAGHGFTELAHAVSAALGEGNHVLVVAGASPGPGTSMVAANLAASLARMHPRVGLVSGDLNSSLAAGLLGVREGGEGLAELIAGSASVPEVIQAAPGFSGLWVITPGADTSAAGYQLQYDTARSITSQLRGGARYLVIETQNSDEGSDTFGFGEFADAALVTTEANHTTKDQVADCLRQLRQLRTPVLGAVVYPARMARAGARTPRPGQPRLGDPVRDATSAWPGPDQPAALSSARAADRRDRAVPSRDGRGDRADRVSGD